MGYNRTMSFTARRLQRASVTMSVPEPTGPNILAGRTFISSVAESSSQPGNGIGRITDQDDMTRWISEPASPVTLTVDLQGVYELSQLRIIWAADTIRDYTIAMSNDGTTWTTIASGTTNNTLKQLSVYTSFTNTPKGRYLRIYGANRWSTEWGNSIWEVAAYGTLDSSIPVHAVPVGGPTGIAWGAPAFEDNFNGTSLDTTRWASSWFGGSTMNDVATSSANVSVSGGNLILRLPSNSSGALVSTNHDEGLQNPFSFTYGYAEARIYFPGSGATIYNWPAWWTNGQVWPGNGENDIAEGLGTMTVNYHSSSGAHNQGTVPGVWANAFHTYALHRKPGSCDVYYDGALVKSYATNDGGAPHYLILNIGRAWGSNERYGSEYAMLVDYVRVWTP